MTMWNRRAAAFVVLIVTLGGPAALAQGKFGGPRGGGGTAAHPSLFLHPSRTSLARISQGDAARALPASELGQGLLGRALRYALHDDKQAAAFVVAALGKAEVPRDVLQLGPWLVEYALAFDWVYAFGDFTPDQRKAAAAVLEQGIGQALALVRQPKLSPAIAEYVEWLCSAGVAALALYKEVGGIKRLREIHGLFLGRVVPFQIEVDGGRPDGPWKGVTRALGPLLLYIWAYSSVQNQNLADQLDRKGRGWVRRAGQWIVAATLPDGSLVHQGDAPRELNTRDEFLRLFLVLAQVFGEPAFVRYKTKLRGWWGNALDRGARWPELDVLWGAGRVPPAPARRELLGQLFGPRTLGHYFGRDQADAVRVRFNAGRFYYPEQHLDQGAFAIWRETPLAVDQGWTAGAGADDALRKLARSSAAHNVLRLVPPGGGSGEQEIGKQRRGGLVKQFRPGLAGDAILAELTGAYPQAGLERYVRQLVYVRPGTVIVVDTVKTRQPGWELVWQLQSAEQPVIEPRQPWRVDRRGSRLVCRALRPAGVAPRVVAATVPNRPTFWRSEFAVKSDAAQTTLLFVLQAHARDKPLPELALAEQGRQWRLTVGKVEVLLDPDGRTAARLRSTR